MAERRMFAKTIIDSDAFLDMPLSAQALYFHLCMRADDDGFINNPKKIRRMAGCAEDDMKLLLLKSFVIPFESGVCVIRHWKIHNYIQKDRYKETQCQEEKRQLEIQKSGLYSLPDEVQKNSCIQPVSESDTQVRLGKVRKEIGKNIPPISPTGEGQAESLTVEMARGAAEAAGHSATPVQGEFEEFWKAYPKKVGKGAAERAWKKIKPGHQLCMQMVEAVKRQKQCGQWQRDGGQYIPNPATWLNQRRWEDDMGIPEIESATYPVVIHDSPVKFDPDNFNMEDFIP